MTEKQFFARVTNGRVDVIRLLLETLRATGTDYCVIGGLAVNAYAEPVVSLDLDIVVALENMEKLLKKWAKIFQVECFPHSINLSHGDSGLRIQVQTDARYQEFIARSAARVVLGYELQVAAVEDVLQGKLWAYLDQERRPSKRQKDLADILRLLESKPELKNRLPDGWEKSS